MTRRFYKNGDPGTTLATGINASVTSITVANAGSFPTSTPYAVVVEKGTANAEICLVTAVVGNVLTVTRGYNSTTAVSHGTGVAIVSGVIALDLDDAAAHVAATSGAHGVAGTIVGTTDSQTLTNKTLTSPTISGPTVTGTSAGQNETLSGTLNVTGTTTLGTVNTGAVSASTVTASGAVTANGAGAGLAVTNNATVGGTLNVTSAIAGSSVSGIVVPKSFTNQAAAGTATAGYVVYLTAPTGGFAAGLFRGNGTIWLPVTGQIGGRATTTAAQAITANTVTALTNNGSAAWTATEDYGGFVSATGGTTTPIIVPANLGGLYLVGVAFNMNNVSTTRAFAEIRVNGAISTRSGRAVFTGDSNVAYTTPVRLAAADTVGANIFNNIAGNANIGCEIFAFRIAD